MRYFPYLLLLAFSCNMNTNLTVQTITADGKIIFSDGSERPVPHYNEPDYIILYAVRHCEKAKDSTDNPDLSPEGRTRAEKLGRVFDNARIDRICTTNFKRTLQTGEIVKRFAGDPPTETFPPAAQDDWLAELLSQGGAKNYIYVGHQNTVPQLLNRLKGGSEFRDIPDTEFGRLYIAATKGLGQTEVLELQY